MKRTITTIVVGPDGREYDLAVERFPKTPDYIPANAFTREVAAENASRDVAGG